MNVKPYQNPVLRKWEDTAPEVVLCTSDWTDGSISGDSADWNEWGEI